MSAHDGRPADSDSTDPDGASPRYQADLTHWTKIARDDRCAEQIERISTDERVDLGARVLRRMRARAILLDTERLTIAAAARLVLQASDYAGEIPLSDWLDLRVDQAVDELLDEDAFEEADGTPVENGDVRYARLARTLAVDEYTLRRATIVFHRLPHEERAVFWATIVDGQALATYARTTRTPMHLASRRLEQAVTAFCSLGRPAGPEDHGPTERSQG